TTAPLARVSRSPGVPVSWTTWMTFFALGLEIDGVHVPGTGDVDLPRHHRSLGPDAARLFGGGLHVTSGRRAVMMRAEAVAPACLRAVAARADCDVKRTRVTDSRRSRAWS